MNRKYPHGPAALPRYRGRLDAGPDSSWGRSAAIIGGSAIGLSVILFLVSMISGVLVHTSHTLNSL